MKNISKTQPLISVIMPVYNAGSFLVEAIESILNQTFQDFELIIIDDASKDNSWEIIKKYKKRLPKKIRCLRLERNINKGGDACANIAYQMARGEYIARMDADDIAYLERLEKQVAFMKKNKDVIVLGTQAYVIDKNGRITGEKLEPTDHRKIRQDYFIYHPIIHPSVLIRRSLLPKRKDLYKIKYSANNDLLTFFELMKYGRFANLSEKLLYYRIHDRNDSLVNPKEKFMNTFKIRVFAWKYFGYEPNVKAVLMNILQLLVTATMPSFIITFLYMLWRGLVKPWDYFNFSTIRDGFLLQQAQDQSAVSGRCP